MKCFFIFLSLMRFHTLSTLTITKLCFTHIAKDHHEYAATNNVIYGYISEKGYEWYYNTSKKQIKFVIKR